MSTSRTDALRPLRIGEILDASIKLTVRHFMTFLKVVLVATGPLYVLIFVGLAVTFPVLLEFSPDEEDLAATQVPEGDDLSVLIGAGVLVGLLFVIASVVAQGACFQTVDDAWRGREPDWRRSLRATVPLIGSLLWLFLLVVLAMMLIFAVPLALGAIAGEATAVLGGLVGLGLVVWLGVRLALSVPVLFGEDARGTEAMRRSWSLVGGRWWRTFAVLAIGFVLAGVVAQIAAFVVGIVPGILFPESLVVLTTAQLVGNLLGTLISTPAIAAIVVVTYFDLRVRKEGYDLELRAAALGGEATGTPGAGYLGTQEYTAEERAQAPFWPPPPGWRPERPAGVRAAAVTGGDEAEHRSGAEAEPARADREPNGLERDDDPGGPPAGLER